LILSLIIFADAYIIWPINQWGEYNAFDEQKRISSVDSENRSRDEFRGEHD
jgi:hypothetical protein